MNRSTSLIIVIILGIINFSCKSSMRFYEDGFLNSLELSNNFDDTNPYFPLKINNRWVYEKIKDGEILDSHTIEITDIENIKILIGGKIITSKCYKILSSLSNKPSYGLNTKSGTIIFQKENDKISYISHFVPREFEIFKNDKKNKWQVFYPKRNFEGYDNIYGIQRTQSQKTPYDPLIQSKILRKDINHFIMIYSKGTGLIYWNLLVNPVINSKTNSKEAENNTIYRLVDSVLN